MITATVLTAASGTESAASAFFDLIATAVIFVALIRILGTPSHLWSHGRLSKAAWVIASVWFTPYLGWLVLPVGAAAAIWKTHTIHAAEQPEPIDIPFAEGTVQTEPEEAR